VQSSLLDLRHILCEEAERDRRLNVTILNVEWLLWAGIGVAMVAAALVGVALYHPQRRPWASGAGLAIAGVLLMDVAMWILLAAKSWRMNARGTVPRKEESENNTHSILIFVTYNDAGWRVDTTILGEKESALLRNEATDRRKNIG
jgi:hypothetical protein